MVKQPMDDPLESACKWAAGQHTRISSFGVCLTSAEGRYIVAECATLDEAREAARKCEPEGFGRKPIIIALTPEGWVYEMEEVAPE